MLKIVQLEFDINKSKQNIEEIMSVKANEVLEILKNYQSDIYTIDILDRMVAHDEYMDKNKLKELYYYNSVEEVKKSILELITKETPDELSEYFGGLSDTVMTFIMVRFQNYEEHLEALGESDIEVSEEFHDFLKDGLITLWEEQIKNYSFSGNN
jgi:hypothetical protein